MTPILKYGQPVNHIPSYTAISVTINFNKIYEDIRLRRIGDQLIKNHISSPCQHGFVPVSSCEYQLIDFIFLKTTSFNDKDCKFVKIVFFDYKDSFDKVDHHLVLRYLSSIGIRGHYFVKRKQRVKFNSQFSNNQLIT